MTVLVLGRARRILDSVIPLIERSGFAASGVTTVAQARSALGDGGVDVLIIGAGVDWMSRTTLKKYAQRLGVRVIEARPGHRSPEAYIREEVIPQLHHDGGRR